MNEQWKYLARWYFYRFHDTRWITNPFHGCTWNNNGETHNTKITFYHPPNTKQKFPIPANINGDGISVYTFLPWLCCCCSSYMIEKKRTPTIHSWRKISTSAALKKYKKQRNNCLFLHYITLMLPLDLLDGITSQIGYG